MARAPYRINCGSNIPVPAGAILPLSTSAPKTGAVEDHARASAGHFVSCARYGNYLYRFNLLAIKMSSSLNQARPLIRSCLSLQTSKPSPRRFLSSTQCASRRPAPASLAGPERRLLQTQRRNYKTVEEAKSRHRSGVYTSLPGSIHGTGADLAS